MSSDFVALFQYVNNASRKMKNIKNKTKAANTQKYYVEELTSVLGFQIMRIQRILKWLVEYR